MRALIRRTILLAAAAVLVPACSKGGYGGGGSGGGVYTPAAFSLFSPANLATGLSNNPTFVWSASGGATSFVFQLATDATLTNLLINQGGLGTLDYTPTDSLTNGTVYYWQVIAVNVYGSTPASGGPFSFTTSAAPAAPPGGFTMTEPANGATGVVTTPTYRWGASAGAESYSLQVSTDSGFATFAVNQAGIKLTAFTPSTALAVSTLYYWRVTAVNGTGTMLATGAPSSFTTGGPVPGPFTLTSPSNGAIGVSKTPTYVWGTSSNASTYTLQVALDVGFSSLVVNQSGLAATSYTPGGTLAGSTYYYWRVTAFNANGATSSSGSYFYFITGP